MKKLPIASHNTQQSCGNPVVNRVFLCYNNHTPENTTMSMVKQHLYLEQYGPEAEDMEEYLLYCYYMDMVEKYNTTNPEELFAEAFGEEESYE